MYSEKELNYFNSNYNIILFILMNIIGMLSSLIYFGINHLLGITALYLIFFSIITMLIVYKKINSYLPAIIFTIVYVLLSLIQVIPLNLIFIFIHTIWFFIIIKISCLIPEKDLNTQKILNYVYLNDFSSTLASQEFDIPIINNQTPYRLIDKELELMRNFNQQVKIGCKITETNFAEFNTLNFYIPKSLLISIYQNILNNALNKPNNIRFNIRNNTYFEFYVPVDIINNHNKIKDFLEKLSIYCKHNKVDILGLDWGTRDRYFIIRLKFKEIKANMTNILPIKQNTLNNLNAHTDYENI